MPCGGHTKSPRTISIVQIIFSFWSFEISEGILRNQKFIIGLDSFSNQSFIYFVCLDISSLCTELHNYIISLWLHFAKFKGSLKRTAVWPIPFLINMLTALKGSQFYFYLSNPNGAKCIKHRLEKESKSIIIF